MNGASLDAQRGIHMCECHCLHFLLRRARCEATEHGVYSGFGDTDTPNPAWKRPQQQPTANTPLCMQAQYTALFVESYSPLSLSAPFRPLSTTSWSLETWTVSMRGSRLPFRVTTKPSAARRVTTRHSHRQRRDAQDQSAAGGRCCTSQCMRDTSARVFLHFHNPPHIPPALACPSIHYALRFLLAMASEAHDLT